MIVRNRALRDWGNLSAAFGGSLLTYYRPLVEMLFTVESHAFGLGAPSCWHAVNVSLHLAVSLLVFTLARTMTTPVSSKSNGAGGWCAPHPK